MAPQRSLFTFIAAASCVASVFAAPSGQPLDSGAVFNKIRLSSRDIEYINEHHEQYRRNDNETLAARTVIPDIKLQLDAVMVKTAKFKHYFWTGWTLPGSHNTTSVMDPAEVYAKAHGGITLEAAIKAIAMPKYEQRDKDSTDTWDYASEEFAKRATGDVYLIHGDDARTKGVWTDFEFPRLKERDEVSRVLRINMHTGGKTDKEIQIWPDCAELLDKKPACPASARFYHGSANKPRITAKTTLAKDGRAVVTKGNAPRMSRGCNEAIDGKMLRDLMLKAGVCTKDAGIKKKLKDILSSAQNRQYVQKGRISSMVENLKSDTVNAMKFKSSPLDGLVAIDYYERTLNDSKAVAKQIDNLLKTNAGWSNKVESAWAAKIKKMQSIKATLVLLVQQQIAAQKKQAAGNQGRNAACGGKAPVSKPFAAPSRRMERRFSPLPRSSLEARVVKAPRSGAKAPAAPACPLKSAPPKKVVPRNQVKTKAPPAKKPRAPAKAPARKPANAQKKVTPRPANRARRTPGKTAPRKRTVPKRKPKVVPKPTRRPKGKPRSRKSKGRK